MCRSFSGSWAWEHQVPVVHFAKGQRKDDVMQQFLAGHDGSEGVLFIGRAQEKTSVFRTEKRRGADGVSYPWIVKTTGVVNRWFDELVTEPGKLTVYSAVPAGRVLSPAAALSRGSPGGRPGRFG